MAGCPDEHRAEHAHATVVAGVEAAHVGGLDGVGGCDELLERGGRLHACGLEERGAVVQQLHVDGLRDAVDLALEHEPVDHRRVEVGQHRIQDVVQRLELARADHVQRTTLLHLEDVWDVIGEQLRREDLGIVARGPLHLDGGVGVLGRVAFDGLLDPCLAVLVVPLLERDVTAGGVGGLGGAAVRGIGGGGGGPTIGGGVGADGVVVPTSGKGGGCGQTAAADQQGTSVELHEGNLPTTVADMSPQHGFFAGGGHLEGTV